MNILLDSVVVEISGSTVLRGVDLKIEEGQTTVLIGRNGAGKTSTLRTIMGVLRPISGNVMIDRGVISDKPAYMRASWGIGYAPEDRRIVPTMSVEDNLLLPAIALKLKHEEVCQRLERVYELLPELKDLSGRIGGGVSGGQGKMVALGRALMVATEALLLDEPFQGLAPALAKSYAAALARVRASKPDLTLLITESSPDLLDVIADNTFQIERGAIEIKGKLDDEVEI